MVQQENSAYNGRFESSGYHPLLPLNREGDCLAGKLRPGSVRAADGREQLLLPEIERQPKQGEQVVFRADAAFAKPESYEAPEERGVKYAIRIPANDSLERDIAERLTRPGPEGVPRPSHKSVVRCKSFLYQAAGWTNDRRMVAKVEFHLGGLFCGLGFIVTNLETDSRAMVRFSNGGGTAEQRSREGKQAVRITRLTCATGSPSNEVQLPLTGVMAYNPANSWRWVPSGPHAAAAREQVVAERAATMADQGRRPVDQARALVLASAGARASDAPALRGHCAAGPRGLPGVRGAPAMAAKEVAPKTGAPRRSRGVRWARRVSRELGGEQT